MADENLAPSTGDLREQLGHQVREVWVAWAREQPNPKPSWLAPWEELAEPDREADRRIGQVLYDRGRAAAAGGPTDDLREQITAVIDEFGSSVCQLNADLMAQSIESKVVAPLLAAKDAEIAAVRANFSHAYAALKVTDDEALGLRARVAELTRERDACPCRPVQIHAQACERLDAQQELLVEALDDYQAESRGEISWAGIAGTALAALAASGGRPSAQDAPAPTEQPATVAGLVLEFHRAFGLPINDQTRTLNKLRAELIREEAKEAADAIESGDLEHMAKELADLGYVTFGAALTMGIDLDTAITKVHESNMSKLVDGKPVMRPDGKVLKGPNYIEPDLSSAILRVPSGGDGQ